MRPTGIEQDPLGRRRFASIDVSDNPDVPVAL
jgi:hypothetical protein